ncbi:unnamed protein product [Lactuca virosa]|uniref:RRM domain-containing protein n=1 Tax=Lactuca virosa TaxID=75947 RepID=A0AAU9M2P6_9ASTR|nr:unnamed protein product [Lactuca virosa]
MFSPWVDYVTVHSANVLSSLSFNRRVIFSFTTDHRLFTQSIYYTLDSSSHFFSIEPDRFFTNRQSFSNRFNTSLVLRDQKTLIARVNRGVAELQAELGFSWSDVTDYTLQETFRAHYQSVRSAKAVTDRMTGHTKGYGFVKFGDETEQIRVMTEMNGSLCSTRPMLIGPAANKNTTGGQQNPKGHQGALSCKIVAMISAEIVTPVVGGLAQNPQEAIF